MGVKIGWQRWAKAYFHKDSSLKQRSKAYIIQHDRVKVLNHDTTYGTIKVEYRGENGTFRGWISVDKFGDKDK